MDGPTNASQSDRLPAQAGRRRWARRLVAGLAVHTAVSLLAIFVAFLLGWATFARGLREPAGWHKVGPASEFRARHATLGYTLEDYLKREAAVFAELDALIDGAWKAESGRVFNRFNRASVSFPGVGFDRDWNRTTVLEHPAPHGGALMVHGLSDSPYSLRAAAEQMHDAGWTVVALRVPGHGTSPAALTEASWRDWAAAVRAAVQGVRGRIPEGAPLLLFGYSNGAALCVDYTLDALADESLARPDGLVLFSPMIGITPLAKITRLHHLIAWIPAFEKVRWSRIEEEVDPYKYGSWPTNASEQAFLLTSRLSSRLSSRTGRAAMERFPPVLTFQSVVDSTVRVRDLITVLYDRLPAGRSELVLFDLNRIDLLEDLLQFDDEAFIQSRLDDPRLAYRLTLVTDGADGLAARTRAGDAVAETPLGLRWPGDVFSLSHGAMPFPADDPILGTREATAAHPGPNLGSIQIRGEHGVLRISEGFTVRLRHNPFYEVVRERMEKWIGEVRGREG